MEFLPRLPVFAQCHPFWLNFCLSPPFITLHTTLRPHFASICVPKRPPDVPRTPPETPQKSGQAQLLELYRTIDLRGQCCICSTLGGPFLALFKHFILLHLITVYIVPQLAFGTHFGLQNGAKMPPKSFILSTFRENGDIEQTLAGVVETPH